MADDNTSGREGEDAIEQRYLGFEPMDFQEEELATSSSSLKDTRFDTVIGHIEDIIMEEEFQTMQNEFMEKYYSEFEDTEENKFVYTDIHKEYCELVETHIQKELEERIAGFDMAEFAQQLESRRNDLDGEIFDILTTFSDFVMFKEMFLDYRSSKEHDAVDLSLGITVTPLGQLDSNLSIGPSLSTNQPRGGGDSNGTSDHK